MVTSYEGECKAIIYAIGYAVKEGWRNIRVDIDSEAVKTAIIIGKVPWKLRPMETSYARRSGLEDIKYS